MCQAGTHARVAKLGRHVEMSKDVLSILQEMNHEGLTDHIQECISRTPFNESNASRMLQVFIILLQKDFHIHANRLLWYILFTVTG
jgi:hypothetical protein